MSWERMAYTTAKVINAAYNMAKALKKLDPDAWQLRDFDAAMEMWNRQVESIEHRPFDGDQPSN